MKNFRESGINHQVLRRTRLASHSLGLTVGTVHLLIAGIHSRSSPRKCRLTQSRAVKRMCHASLQAHRGAPETFTLKMATKTSGQRVSFFTIRRTSRKDHLFSRKEASQQNYQSKATPQDQPLPTRRARPSVWASLTR